MDFLNYFLISLVVYLGLLIGIILSFMAKEELKDGKRYFILLHNIILGFILFFVLEFFRVNVYLALFLPLVLIVVLFYFNELYKKSYITYFLLGIVFYISSKNVNFLLVVSSLILFYGFFIGSLQINFKKKNYFRILLNNLLFFVCLVLFFI
ncbi:hypothetical protein CEE44_04275 [Candidatus Woesearchaeota archaeon B3_Woes]|nr:MAG: hypothetical protein CEE44_04275 [Candidatus Woesearchaeota archaeon B3_Woes]